MELISTSEAAKLKGVSRQAIINAVKRGSIDGQKVSARTLVIVVNERLRAWEPNPVRRAAGLANRDRIERQGE
jgi:hypothetical protein